MTTAVSGCGSATLVELVDVAMPWVVNVVVSSHQTP